MFLASEALSTIGTEATNHVLLENVEVCQNWSSEELLDSCLMRGGASDEIVDACGGIN